MLEVILEDLKNQHEVRKNLIQIKELLKDEETRKELSELSAGNSIFLEFLNDSFKLHNIDFKKNNLKVGYEDGIKVSKYKDVFSTFNISIYCIQNLQTIISEELVVVDGQCDEKQHELLATLSNITSFNVQQYDIEHATTDRDILVEAGAGTGKTYSMVSRIAFLCNKRITNHIKHEWTYIVFFNNFI